MAGILTVLLGPHWVLKESLFVAKDLEQHKQKTRKKWHQMLAIVSLGMGLWMTLLSSL